MIALPSPVHSPLSYDTETTMTISTPWDAFDRAAARIYSSTDSGSTGPRKPDVLTLARKPKKWLTQADMVLLRYWNQAPTHAGVEHCRERQLCSAIKSLPHFLSRFDRRIPCWRSTRWKSLT